MQVNESQLSEGSVQDRTGPTSNRPQVFLFVACAEDALSSFERTVRELGMIDCVEPIAVSVYPTPEYLAAFLEENRSDIACVTIGLTAPEEAIDLIELTAKTAPDALLLAADDGSRAESLLPALRAGARAVISPPYDLHELVRRLREEGLSFPESKGKVAFFLPAQGGAGASTAAIHFAASVSNELRMQEDGGSKVSPTLLLDLDFHSDSAAFWLNKRPGYSLIDALDGAAASAPYWRKVTTAWNGVDLLSPPPPDRYVSEEMLESLPDVIRAAGLVYRWVVVDLPPTLFASSRKLLPDSDLVFLVCTPDARALYLARRRLMDLRRLGVGDDALRVTLNRVGAKGAIEAVTAEKAIGASVHFSIDNDYAGISAAYSERRLAEAGSGPGRQFRFMARAAMGIEQRAPEKRSGWRRLVGLG